MNRLDFVVWRLRGGCIPIWRFGEVGSKYTPFAMDAYIAIMMDWGERNRVK